VRVETIGNATLYLGDCLEIIPTLGKVDAVITDPPYCSGGDLEAQKQGAKAQGLRGATVAADDFEWFVSDNMSTQGLLWMLRNLVAQCRDVLLPNRSMLFFTDWRMVSAITPAMESAGVRYRNMIIWDKGNGGLGNGFKPRYEVILEFCKGQAQYHVLNASNVISVPRVSSSEKEHGAQKPVELMEELIRVVVPQDGIVLDPFMGSGTTGVAALNLGRKFIGVEISPSNFATACERITNSLRQERLFA
jgi:site-specific DNA-methyltransferase (adenine-specific)